MLRLEELKTMEIESFSSSSSNVTVLNKMVYSVMESVVLETVLVAGKSLFCFLLLAGSMNIDVATALPRVPVPDERISLVGYQKVKRSVPEKDASDTEDDEEEDDDDAAGDEEDDAGDEDFSGEEENEDDAEDDPEAAKANGAGGSDDEDDDEDEDDEDEDGEDEDEEEEDEDDEDEETPQPPAKKRK